MKKTALIITGVMCLVLAFWSFSFAAEDLKTMGYLNINYASVEELQMLPGLDEITAKNITYFRQANGPFSTIDDLLKVNGMTPEKLEAIRPTIRVEGKSTLQAAGL